MYITALCIIAVLKYSEAKALNDDLKKSVEIAAHATKFQSERIKVISENIANSTSTSSISGGNPYRRKIIFANNKYDKSLNTNIMVTKKVDFDNSDFIIKYEPHHPGADTEGYVKYPNINKEIERSDIIEAQNSYEANLSIMEITNSLIQKTVEAIR